MLDSYVPVPVERTELDDGRRVLRMGVPGGPWITTDEARALITELQDGIAWVQDADAEN